MRNEYLRLIIRSYAQVRMSTKAKTFGAIKGEMSNFPRVGSERRIDRQVLSS